MPDPIQPNSDRDQNVVSLIVTDIKKKREIKTHISKKQVEKIASALSEIAFNDGLTNEIEKFSQDLQEDLFEALKEVKKRLKAKKQKK